MIHIAPDAELDRAEVAADVKRIWKLGIASRVDVDAVHEGGRVVVIYHVEPSPRIAHVEITGATRDQVPTLAALEGTLEAPLRLQRMVAVATERLHNLGYLRARIETSTTSGHMLRVHVSLGTQYRLAEVTVTGSKLPTPRTLFEQDLGRTNVHGGVYRADAFAGSLAALVNRHCDAGYLSASADAPVVTYDEAHARVHVTAAFHAGPRFRLAEVAIDGDETDARALVARALEPLRGQVFDTKLRDTVRAAQRQLDDAGFSSSVMYELHASATVRVLVTFWRRK